MDHLSPKLPHYIWYGHSMIICSSEESNLSRCVDTREAKLSGHQFTEGLIGGIWNGVSEHLPSLETI